MIKKFISTTIGDFLNEQMLVNKNHQYEYAYNCTSPLDYDELKFIIDNMKEVSSNIFLKNVSLEEINNSLMDGINYKSKEHVKSDWSLSFYRIKKGGIDAFILVNSAIEYIYKK